jgi:hypothetical protein
LPLPPTGLSVVNLLDTHSLSLQWIASTDPIVGYNVYRSPSSGGTFVKINNTLVSVNDYIDSSIDQKIRTDYWYYVTSVDALSVESAPSNIETDRVTDPGPLRYVLKEIIRRQKIILNNDGEYVHVLIRKTVGNRCVNFDLRRSQATFHDDACGCYGTNWVGGYDVIPNVLIRLARAQSQIDFKNYGRDIIATPRGWATNSPLIHPNDVIVDSQNRRYEVSSIAQYTPAGGLVTRQDLQLTELEPSHMVYKLLLPMLARRG